MFSIAANDDNANRIIRRKRANGGDQTLHHLAVISVVHSGSIYGRRCDATRVDTG
jgi:hypothetical protein